MKNSSQKDSTILAYVKSMNDIQDILDSIKTTEKILSVNISGVENKNNSINDIRAIEAQLVRYHKEIYSLQDKLKRENAQNSEIERMNKHLSMELAEKDSDISYYQRELLSMNDSLKAVARQFNDTMVVVNRQKSTINDMTNEMHTIYYAVGSTKEFKKTGIITKTGGFIGIGRTTTLKQNFNGDYFTKGDMTQLHVIPLYSRFDKLVTVHPTDSYKVTDNKKSDSLTITDPSAFWSTSKYLVIVVQK